MHTMAHKTAYTALSHAPAIRPSPGVPKERCRPSAWPSHRIDSRERYYNQARSVEASRLMQESLLARRNDVLGADDPTDTIL